ncbi:hypothetical protein [uncultured Thiodictyon sp.]|uniref:hypothetical protein n=1 Tax=uncultured Thiodictyon sp. TaxID=1846217 RepID=UPI0025F1907D|nr:hypothetical protein [uncultured Thiodictyon sp.]
MSDRPALRIAFAFALALTIAQAAGLEATFIRPAGGGTLAALPAPPPALLIGLPLIAWGIMIAVVAVTGLLASWPLALMVAMVGIFLVGFRLSRRPPLAVITLLVLVLFAVVPDLVMRYPAAAGGMTDAVVRNCLAASAAVFLATRFFPTPATAVPAPALPTAFAAPIPPLAAALALTVAAWAVWIIGPPAPGAVLVSVVIGLRPGGEPPERTLRDRFDAALLGAGLAIVGTALIELAHSLIVLPLAVMVATWPWPGASPRAAQAAPSPRSHSMRWRSSWARACRHSMRTPTSAWASASPASSSASSMRPWYCGWCAGGLWGPLRCPRPGSRAAGREEIH